MQPPFPPLEPPPARVTLPDADRANRDGIVALSRTMTPGLVLQAYRKGIFPWPIAQGLVPWASPDPRAHYPLDSAEPWPRHVRRALKLPFEVTFDEAFQEVMEACAAERAEGTWITPDVLHSYSELNRLGWAHSVEVWDGDELAGGLYGLAVGSLFAGESMFHRRTDASKVALVALVERLRDNGFGLLDVQWVTPHLASLGAIDVPRERYLDMLAEALPTPAAFA